MYEEITALLISYPEKKIQIEQLRFELEHPALVGERELIDSLAAGHQPDGGGTVKSGRISDRTMAIAMQYQDTAARINSETLTEIMRELRCLEAEVSRMEFYLSLLDEKKARVIRLYYFDGWTLEQIEKDIKLAKATVVKHRNDALRELDAMFSYLDRVKGSKETRDEG